VPLGDQKFPVFMNDRAANFDSFHEPLFLRIPRLNDRRYCTQQPYPMESFYQEKEKLETTLTPFLH
jgi:hypothetical protein